MYIIKQIKLTTILLAMLFLPLLSSFAKPIEKPVLKTKDPYEISELNRLYRFYERRETNASLCSKIATLLDDLGEDKQAIKWYRQAIILSKNNIDFKNKMKRKIEQLTGDDGVDSSVSPNDAMEKAKSGSLKDILFAADILDQNNKMNLSANYYRRAFTISKKRIYLLKAIERYSWAGKNDRALSNFEILLKYKKPSVKDYLKAIKLAEWSDNQQKAIEYLKKACKISSNNYFEHRLARKYIETGNLKLAELAFLKIIEKNPSDSRAEAFLADIYAWTQQYKRSLNIYKSLPISLMSAERILSKARVELALGKDKDCLSDIDKLLDSRNTDREPSTGLIAVNIALEALGNNATATRKSKYFKLGQKFEAKLADKRIIPSDEKIEMWKFTARKLRAEKNYSEAKKAYETWARITPSDTECLTGLIALYKRENNKYKVKMLLEKYHIAYPNDEWAITQLANAHIDEGHPWRAKLLLETALRNGARRDDLKYALVKVYQKTKSWNKLLAIIYKGEKLDPDYLFETIDALKNSGKKPQAARIILSELKKDPSNLKLAKELKDISRHYPVYYKQFLILKPKWERYIEIHELASVSARLIIEPENYELRKKRAQMLLWNNKPKEALKDYKKLLRTYKKDKVILKKAIDSAEWAGFHKDTLAFRKRLEYIEPKNATNSLRIANELSYMKKPGLAYKQLKKVNLEKGSSKVDYAMSSFQILTDVKRFLQARRALDKLKRKQLKLSKSYTYRDYDYAKRTLSKDIGPVVRTSYDFMHDSDLTYISKVDNYSRFGVKNNRYFEASLTDYSFSHDNSIYRSFKGQELKVSGTRADEKSTLTVGFDALRNHYDSKVNVYTPFVDYTFRNNEKETEISFGESPVVDTPEAMRRNISYKHFRVRHFTPVNKNNNLTLFFEHDRNSDGIDRNLYGFGWDLILKNSPFRAINYSMFVDDSEPENSDLYYSENYLITHKLSWLGDYTVKLHPGNRKLYFNWELYMGLNSENEGFRGATLGVEGPIGRDLYWLLRGTAQASDDSRFAGAKSYNFWNYSLALEWRGW